MQWCNSTHKQAHNPVINVDYKERFIFGTLHICLLNTISGVLDPSMNPLRSSILLGATREFPFSLPAFLQDRIGVQHQAVMACGDTST